jgi:hypothetical protein
MEKLLESIAKAILREVCGHGTWSSGKRDRVNVEYTKGGLKVGDKIHDFDFECLEFEEQVVVYVDGSGVAYYVVDDDENFPELGAVGDYWYKSKEEAAEIQIAELRQSIANIEKAL